MMVRFVATVLLLCCVERAMAQCSTFSDEPSCEAETACYWKTWDLVDECDDIPTTNAECVCSTSPVECTNNIFGPPSGCQPQRFCQYSLTDVDNCIVVNPPLDDDDCKLDGGADLCVPSEFCEETTPFFTSCRIIRPPTPQPTDAPQVPTFKPTKNPIPFKPADEGAAVNVPLVAGGAVAGAVVFAVLALVVFMVRRSKDTSALRGVVTAEQYLEHAKPRVPKPPKRQMLTDAQQGQEAQGMKLVVSFDFEGENDDELTVSQGTYLLGLVRYDQWWEARTEDGDFGIIPISYVTELGVTEGILDPENLRSVDAVDF